jgi:HK97 family phage prohead protease
MLLKVAPTTTTDLGEFEAVISTESVDREKDVVSADGMVRALHKWNRPVPLSWNHSTKAEDIVGHVNPQSARNVNGEVVINGNVDLASAQGGEAWRSFKSGSVGFSFGYLIPDGGSTDRKGGGRSISELDVFEVTATPTPMNNDTRVLSVKAMASLADRMNAMADEMAAGNADPKKMAARMRALATEMAAAKAMTGSDMSPEDILNMMLMCAQEYIDNAPDSEDATEMQGIVDDLKELVADVDDAADMAEDASGKSARKPRRKTSLQQKADETARAADPLRQKADALALEHASGGESRRKPPRPEKVAPPQFRYSVQELRRRTRDEMLSALSGIEEP